MGLEELAVAVLIVGLSCINAALPVAAYRRSRDGRFLLLASANIGLAALGALWVWGAVSSEAPGWTVPTLPVLALVLIVAILLLAATLWPRHV